MYPLDKIWSAYRTFREGGKRQEICPIKVERMVIVYAMTV